MCIQLQAPQRTRQSYRTRKRRYFHHQGQRQQCSNEGRRVPPTFCFSDRTTAMTPTLTIPTRTQLSPLRMQPAAIGNSSRVTPQPAPQSLKHSPITAPFLLTATAPQAVLPPISASPPTKASLRKTTATVGQSTPAAQHGSTAATFSIISTVRISATRSYGSASAKA